jgi:nitroreductase
MAAVLKERTGALRAIYGRRAVRAYTPEQPSEEVIRELLDAAVQAPTAMHTEPWAFVVVQNKDQLRRYSYRAKHMLLDELGAGATFDLDEAARRQVMAMVKNPAFNIFYDAGTLIVICRRPLSAYAKADCWLAAENLMLAAQDKGLGTCCIGFAVPALNEADVKEELHIPAGMTAIAPIIVGRPRGPVAPVSRKPPLVVHWAR